MELERSCRTSRPFATCSAVNGVSLLLGCPWMMASKELDLEVSVGPLG